MLMRLNQNVRPELFSSAHIGGIFDSPLFSQSSHSLLRDLIHEINVPEPDRLFFNPNRLQMRTKETEDSYIITFAVPGLTEKEISLSILNREITLITQPVDGDEKRNEQRYRSTSILPEKVNSEEVKATLENGILSVELKKVIPIEPRLIEIKTP